MIACPQCGVRVPEDAAACYNCAFDLHKAEVEDMSRSRKSILGVLMIAVGIVCLLGIGVLQGVRYSRWSAYHEQVRRMNSYDAPITGASGLPVPPNDPMQGSLKGWWINSDPYPKADPTDNVVVIKN